MRRVIFCISLFLFIFFTFSFSAWAAGPTVVPSTISFDTWTKEGSPYIVNYYTTVNGLLTIQPGVVVKFANSSAGLNVKAGISAVGTENEKITFTSIHDDSVGGDSDSQYEGNLNVAMWDSINVSPNFPAKFENVALKYGTSAIKSAASSGSQYNNLEVKNSEISSNYKGIDIQNLAPDIERNIIKQNMYGIWTQTYPQYAERIAIVKHNIITGNNLGIGANNSFAITTQTVDARYNWWGDEKGPKVVTKNPNTTGDAITDYWISFDPWIRANPREGPDPVIIVPGVMGSWEVNGSWKIDPILRSYENLKQALKSVGYKEGERMYDFPYQWRNSNVENAKLLRDAVDIIKEKTGRLKVDIVAHSMGGLLAREYIESDDYNDDVDQLIMLGTPQKGAPKAYLLWEAGEFPDLLGILAKKIFTREAEKAGYNSLFHYIRNWPMDSVQELLPQYNYIFDLDLNSPRVYPANYPRNVFLENLNSDARLQNLKKVENDIIYGKVDSDNTISAFEVIHAPAFGDYWEYGYPKSYDNLLWGEEGVLYGEGDGTVPVVSAIGINADKKIELNSSHNNLPTEAQQDVVELLTGERPTGKITSEGMNIREMLLVQVYCPVDITVVDPDGKIVGKDKNGIDGATYINNGDDEEFITIPNPKDGEYKILVQGTGTGGDYKIEATKITGDEKDPNNSTESTMPIAGTAAPGKIEEAKIFVTENGVSDKEDTTPPVLSSGSPSGELSDAASQMEISLQTDEKAVCRYSMVSNAAYSDITNEFATTDDGLIHSATMSGLEQYASYHYFVRCQDENGNANAEDYEITFSVPDKTPPMVTGVVTTIPNANGWYSSDVVVHFTATDAESGIENMTPDITITTEGENQSVTGAATDKAGNSASVAFSGINIDKTLPAIDVASLASQQTYLNDNYALDFSVGISDMGSGIEDSSIEKLLNGELFNDEKLDLSLKNLGSYSYQVRAKDKAGNSGSAEVAFQNTTNLKAIRNNVGHYFDLGLIKNKIAKRYLEVKLKHLEKLFKLLEKTKNSKLKPKPKQTAVEALERVINADINRLIRRVSRRVPRWFD